jgi:hypothetical protein
MSRLLAPLFKTLAILLAFFVLGEELLRVQYYGLAGLSYREMESQALLGTSEFAIDPPVGDSRLAGTWGLRPNTEGLLRGAMFRLNNLGLPGADRELRKAPGTFRIAVLGSSTDLGFGVALEDAWPAVLERMLNDRLEERAGLSGTREPERYEIFNLAMGGTRRCLPRHMQRALYYQPDLVLWSISRRTENGALARGNLRAAAELAGSRSIPIIAFRTGHTPGNDPRTSHPYFEVFPTSLKVDWSLGHNIYPLDAHPDAFIHREIAAALLPHLTEREEALRLLIAGSDPDYTTSWSPPEPIPWSGPTIGGFWTSRLLERLGKRWRELAPRAHSGGARAGLH